MSHQESMLLGRLAIHMKLITPQQASEALRQDKVRFERELEDAKMKASRAASAISPAPGLPRPGR